MQVLYNTEIGGLRSVVLTLERRDSPTRFVLIPMVHVGRPAYYDGVAALLDDADVVLREGVPGWRARTITLSYRIAARLRRNGLVTQRAALRGRVDPDKYVNADVTKAEFRSDWSEVAWWARVLLLVLAPIWGVWIALLGPERVLRGMSSVEDFGTGDSSIADDEDGGLGHALVGSRDRALCAQLAHFADVTDGEPLTVAVPWGAEHIGAATQLLMGARRYRVTSAEYLQVLEPG